MYSKANGMYCQNAIIMLGICLGRLLLDCLPTRFLAANFSFLFNGCLHMFFFPFSMDVPFAALL
jgi:hypothetical protein